jgi:hypothetical protein
MERLDAPRVESSCGNRPEGAAWNFEAGAVLDLVPQERQALDQHRKSW